ncbi:MAG: DNA mismatch repair protein MutS [Rikenellaceae bacterium]|nr:DNA mismatch repair protein MutS [Rikenellaceae bacterium]MCL2692106.1 DNA mismatch repair protein MutS [Rikenellaceae bacterium]
MQFRDAITQVDGLRYIVERLGLCSAASRNVLYDSEFLRSGEAVEAELALVARAGETDMTDVAIELGRVKDLRGSVSRLANGETLDDVELFEVKAFAMAASSVRTMTDIVAVPDVSAVVALLDPDRTGVAHFYVYDSYSQELQKVRRKLRDADEGNTAALYTENERLECEVRAQLSARLSPYAPVLREAAAALAHLDIAMAKAAQTRSLGLCRPTVATAETRYEGLFDPSLREALRARGREFQPVDITLGAGPTVVTGANMGGKTVLLRSLALAQTLFQFGFYIPARAAEIVIADGVRTVINEQRDEVSGLSSFAREVVRINEITAAVRRGERPLVLLDEPAHTTNPAEGAAIVGALLDFLAEHRVRSVITTHYSGVATAVERLRVRGFYGDTEDVTVDNIGDYMDYSLVADEGDDPPREALRIARILGADEKIIERATKHARVFSSLPDGK